MKTIVSILLFCATICQPAQAQNNATASASISANIISPVGTSKINNLDFGSFTASEKAGEIRLASPQQRAFTRTSKTFGSPMTPATFRITANAVFNIFLDDAVALINENNTAEMTLRPFVTAIEEGNDDVVVVGGTLQFTAKQAGGNYAAKTPLSVTICFN